MYAYIHIRFCKQIGFQKHSLEVTTKTTNNGENGAQPTANTYTYLYTHIPMHIFPVPVRGGTG